MLTEVPTHNDRGNILVTGIPVRLSETTLKIERSYPAVGEHNEEIYSRFLGYTRKDLGKLEEEGII
jgi:crotonobetainyl-CoA:carnitine CoA-transferase CaiB-like acyl-CoA transferase